MDSTDSDDVIQRISVKHTSGIGTNICNLTIRKNTVDVERSSLAGVEEVDNLNPGGIVLNLPHIFLDGYIGTPSSLKDFEASTLSRISIGGNWYANVEADNQASPSTSNITEVQVDGSILGGGLFNNEGAISNLMRVDGDVLAHGGATPAIWAASSINTIRIYGDAQVQIGSNGVGFSGHPDVSLVDIRGDFLDPLSPMTMDSLGSLIVLGDFEPVVNISTVMNASATYRIDGSIAAGAELNLPTSGLRGQVIVNGANASGGWAGDVKVGTTTLADLYSNTASSLGGGAAGVVPFDFHAPDCAPVHNATLAYTDAPEDGAPIRIRHYGPVTDDLGASPGTGSIPVIVERQCLDEDPETDPWVDISCCFSRAYASQLAGGAQTILELNPDDARLPGGYRYRVTPITNTALSNALECNLPFAASEIAVEEYEYTFSITASDCAADADADGDIDFDDLNMVLAFWEEEGCMPLGDTNADDVIDFNDLNNVLIGLELVEDEEDPCVDPMVMCANPDSCSESLLGGGEMLGGEQNVPVVLQVLGWESVDDYTDWLSGLTYEQRIEHGHDLFAALMEVLGQD